MSHVVSKIEPFGISLFRINTGTVNKNTVKNDESRNRTKKPLFKLKIAKELFIMKNVFKMFGIILLVAVIGFSMATCDDNSGSSVGGSPSGSSGGSGGNTGGSGGGGAGSGGLTITNFPSEYNGKYAYTTFSIGSGTGVLGCKGFRNDGSWILSRISNGTVTIPLLVPTATGYVRYSGNDTVGLAFSVLNSEDINEVPYSIGNFPSVTFSNGNATVSFGQ